MRFSSVVAVAVCVVLSVSTTRGRRWNNSARKGASQGREYLQTVVKRRKFPRRGTTNRERFSSLSSMWDMFNDLTCEDHTPDRCQKFMKDYGIKTCETLKPFWFKKRVMRKCRKSCGLCQRKGRRYQNRKEVDVMRRRNQPFPQLKYSRGDENTPRSGVYYIYTRQVSL